MTVAVALKIGAEDDGSYIRALTAFF